MGAVACGVDGVDVFVVKVQVKGGDLHGQVQGFCGVKVVGVGLLQTSDGGPALALGIGALDLKRRLEGIEVLGGQGLA